MVGKKERWQEDLFVACTLRDLIPDDHVLKRVDKVLDLSWLRDEVKDLYSEYQGRPSIDPEAAVRLMLAGFFQGVVHDRKLMREAQVNIAIRWFAGYRLHEELPDHSSLTKIRQRWGSERFKRIFQRTVAACVKAGLVDGETVHIDATLIRADVSWESLVERHAERVVRDNPLDEYDSGDAGKGGPRPPRAKKVSTTDPEATLTTSQHNQRMEPSFKQHTAVDGKVGVVVDVKVTTGEQSEGEQLLEQIERAEANTGRKITMVTADGAYAHSANYAALEEGGVEAVIPPQREGRNRGHIPMRRFKYDGRHNLVRCPGRKVLRRSSRCEKGWIYRARRCDCGGCPLRGRCLPRSASVRTILITDGYEALLRARRKRLRWDDEMHERYRLHRWRVEGIHGEAKTQHGLRRAVRRGLANVTIQAYLTAAVINLKRLAALLFLFLLGCVRHRSSPRRLEVKGTSMRRFSAHCLETLAAERIAA